MLLAVALIAAGALLISVATGGGGSGVRHRARGAAVAVPAAHMRPRSYAVGLQTLRLVEPGRTIQLPNGTNEPRTLVTYVRYPALGSPRGTDVAGASPARADGPFPLVVFGHGFAVTPALYARLLESWAHAGYVVAAPVFPLENADASGGPDEADLINQPEDMRFVIASVLAASSSSSGPLSGLVNPSEIAVAGQSDGGDTALAVGYDSRFRDPLVRAVIILSGAELPGLEGFAFAPGDPPLLATQGTADTVNLPSETAAFFEAAHPPKYLLSLPGATHLPPYSYQQPQLGIVERVTRAFLDAYLEQRRGALRELTAAGNVPGSATLVAKP
jgi:dienelactone hydrolase